MGDNIIVRYAKKVPFTSAVAIIFLFLGGYYVTLWICLTLEERGQFGDSFGAINSFLSALGFSALAYSLYLQRSEMHDQRIESAKEQKNIETQLKQIERQNEQFERNHFEATFVKLIEILHTICNTVAAKQSARNILSNLSHNWVSNPKTELAYDTIIKSMVYDECSKIVKSYAGLFTMLGTTTAKIDKKIHYNLLNSILSDPFGEMCYYYSVAIRDNIPAAAWLEAKRFNGLIDIPLHNYHFSTSIHDDLNNFITSLMSSCASQPPRC